MLIFGSYNKYKINVKGVLKMILNETYTLNNGMQLPKLGWGTWGINDVQAQQAVNDVVKVGYRFIDMAQGYENERGVGDGIRNCEINRDQLFIEDKIQAFFKTYKEAKNSINKSLAVTGLNYFDLMIIHAPQPWDEFRGENHYFKENLEVWRALEDAQKEGKVKAIGVSNFEKEDIKNILDHGDVKPVVNQVLCHIGNTPMDLINYCKQNNIQVEAYSPIAHGVILNNPDIKKIADKYHVTVPQLCIRYDLQLGLAPIAKTNNLAHMQSNAEVDFEISADDMEELMKFDELKNYGKFNVFPVFNKN